MTDEKISPFGCYIGKFIDNFTILDEDRNAEHELDAWEVTVMVKARTAQEAYDRIVEIARRDTRPYPGELDGVSIQWELAGVTELEPVFTPPSFANDFIYLEQHEINFSQHQQFIGSRQEFCGLH